MNKEHLYKELEFKAVRSSGSGGQHVNKVSSKVELYFNINNSISLKDEEKNLLLKNLSNRITKDGVLVLSNSESRSQHTNKEKVIKHFFTILEKGLIIPKKRKLLFRIFKLEEVNRSECISIVDGTPIGYHSPRNDGCSASSIIWGWASPSLPSVLSTLLVNV